MPIVSSYITLFVSLFMIISIILTKAKYVNRNMKIRLCLMFSLMTTYSAVGLFWAVVSDSTWIYDYNEIIYLTYNLFLLRKIYNFVNKGTF